MASRVFGRLGVGAVVMEGFANANTVGGAVGMNLEEGLDRVGRIVPTVGATFGAVVDPTGEDVQFVDDGGEFVPPDIMLACFLSHSRPKKAVLPINLSRAYEELIEENGGALEESRTGLGNVALKAAEIRADVAGLADGRYVFPAFLPAPDCFMTLARALELFREEPLSEVRARFGETFTKVKSRRLECPWGAKGRVMRGLAEKFGSDEDAILTDGVKLNLDEGWVLMLPDPDNPLYYVYAEANAGRYGSESLLLEYAELVEDLIKGG